ncbi:MAG: flagellar assembly protein H, partial [Okeania sp. SIO3I5]|nr:flagellar assembly protein H [Okeania sp. SIO3I5]
QFRVNALLSLSSLRSNLEGSSELEEQDRELIMRLSPLLLEKLEAATQLGREEGREVGREEATRMERTAVIESLLKYRFNSVDDELREIIQPMLSLSPEEFTPLLFQLSREELLARFNNGD